MKKIAFFLEDVHRAALDESLSPKEDNAGTHDNDFPKGGVESEDVPEIVDSDRLLLFFVVRGGPVLKEES